MKPAKHADSNRFVNGSAESKRPARKQYRPEIQPAGHVKYKEKKAFRAVEMVDATSCLRA